jgi:hypothetical protein
MNFKHLISVAPKEETKNRSNYKSMSYAISMLIAMMKQLKQTWNVGEEKENIQYCAIILNLVHL